MNKLYFNIHYYNDKIALHSLNLLEMPVKLICLSLTHDCFSKMKHRLNPVLMTVKTDKMVTLEVL